MAARIATIRKRRRMTQWQLAEACRTTRRTVQRLEAGKGKHGPRAELLAQLAAALRCKVGDLLPMLCLALCGFPHGAPDGPTRIEAYALGEREKRFHCELMSPLLDPNDSCM
jgi:transcriptional regulator with XRE-family HTH domain